MPEYRRWRQPGGMFFLTIATHERRRLFADKTNVELLWSAIRFTQEERPFELTAYVIMPDHLHWIVELPENDADYSSRVGRIKALFTKGYRRRIGGRCPPYDPTYDSRGPCPPHDPTRAFRGPCPPYVSTSRARHREGNVWQRRFWEHMIRDEKDFQRHVDYIHYNPVKHGWAACPHDWEESSFGRWVEDRVYERDWCCQCNGGTIKAPDVSMIGASFGE